MLRVASGPRATAAAALPPAFADFFFFLALFLGTPLRGGFFSPAAGWASSELAIDGDATSNAQMGSQVSWRVPASPNLHNATPKRGVGRRRGRNPATT